MDSIRHGARALDWDFFFLKKEMHKLSKFVTVMINNVGDRTSIRPIWSAIILVIGLSGVQQIQSFNEKISQIELHVGVNVFGIW